jgi:lipid-binding SYLF domain-containing protein
MERTKVLRSLAGMLIVVGGLIGPSLARAADGKEDEIARSSAVVLDEISNLPAKGIPEALLANAEAIAIVPGLVKGGFIVGGKHGRGLVMMRDDTGRWTFPVFISITGGSVGWQVGLQSSDVVLVFKTRRSLDGLLAGSKFTLGADVAVAAGPVGRQAEAKTDDRLKAEIYSYSRSRGLFAGVSVDGSVIKIDDSADAAFYSRRGVTAAEVVSGRDINVPPTAVKLLEMVESKAPSNQFRR